MHAIELFMKFKILLKDISKVDWHKHESGLWYANTCVANSYLIMDTEKQTLQCAWGLSTGLAIANTLGLISESDAMGIDFRKENKNE